MLTRQQRRHAQRRAAKHGRIEKSEVFVFTDESGEEQWLAVEPLRHWAEENLSLVGVDIDPAKIEDILSNGRINKDHVTKVTFKSNPRPILVCEEFAEGRAEIVDGNHSYVAMAVAVAKAGEMGIQLTKKPAAPAYVVGRQDWTRFLIPMEQRRAKSK